MSLPYNYTTVRNSNLIALADPVRDLHRPSSSASRGLVGPGHTPYETHFCLHWLLDRRFLHSSRHLLHGAHLSGAALDRLGRLPWNLHPARPRSHTHPVLPARQLCCGVHSPGKLSRQGLDVLHREHKLPPIPAPRVEARVARGEGGHHRPIAIPVVEPDLR